MVWIKKVAPPPSFAEWMEEQRQDAEAKRQEAELPDSEAEIGLWVGRVKALYVAGRISLEDLEWALDVVFDYWRGKLE